MSLLLKIDSALGALKRLISSYFLAALAFILPCGLASETLPDKVSLSSRIDALFAEWDTTNAPGCAVAVVKDGGVVHMRGYGMANLEHGIRIKPDTVFDLASVSKQFTGIAIAMLVNEGRVALDDDIRNWLPQMHDFGKPITVRHLVHHTSGLFDWIALMVLTGKPFEDLVTYDDILRTACRQRELNFAPGAEYLYSNTGYNLLVAIVEKVTKESFPEWMDRRVFEPLTMRSTQVWNDYRQVIARRAESYERGKGGFARITSASTCMGSGSVLSTVEDLAHWIVNLETGAVGGSETLRLLRQRGRLNNGQQINYAFGLDCLPRNGLQVEEHLGRWLGFRSVLRHYPEEKLGIVILANRGDFNSAAMTDKVADLLLGHKLTPETKAETSAERAFNIDPAKLDRFVGEYVGEDCTLYGVVKRDGALLLQFIGLERELRPIGRGEFQPAGMLFQLAFQGEENGRAERCLIRRNNSEETAERLVRKRSNNKEYIGRFYCFEIDGVAEVVLKGHSLVWVQGGTSHDLFVLENDAFATVSHFGARRLQAERDASGQIQSFRLSNRGIRNLRFHRITLSNEHGKSEQNDL